MGAVNTIVVRRKGLRGEGRELVGENTDWIGIRDCVLRHGKPTRAIVVGAGGAARAAVFAIHALGLSRVTLVNRSPDRAEHLVESFPEMTFTLHTHLADAQPADLIVSCVPADDIAEEDIPEQVFLGEGGCVVEMSYRPPVSALMRVAARRAWTVFGGVDVLKEQAYGQFEMWTGLQAPRDVVERALEGRENGG
jgi:shikimate 5-dehydrogenase